MQRQVIFIVNCYLITLNLKHKLVVCELNYKRQSLQTAYNYVAFMVQLLT